jgi:alpha-D-ribose 1-methylphosphonate 5-triphosphate diphosphatase
MSAELSFANARLVLPDEVRAGTLRIAAGRIAAIDSGPATRGEDLEGDYLLPGLVELHTDNLEKHYAPRPGVEWDPVAAAVAHDVQLAGSGITTVYDSLVLGAAAGWDVRDHWLRPMLDGLEAAAAHGMLKIDHRVHFRCEVTHPEVVAQYLAVRERPGLGLISLMDHAPGDRQSPDILDYKRRYRSGRVVDEAEVEAHVQALIAASRQLAPKARRRLAALAAERGVPVASHDDARPAHIEEAAALGCVMSEFPTTLEAARAARSHGLAVLMGAPNLIRGGSHSGNIAAAELARAGLLDILSSDYIPASLLMGAFRLADPRQGFGIPLPAALATVTARPAAAAGLEDRGRLAPGLRADLVRVRLIDGRPVVRGVWVAGERVA